MQTTLVEFSDASLPHGLLCSAAPCHAVLCCVQSCEVLARAMKEWDRRPGERSGFTDSPGDCMAFKHLRDVRDLSNTHTHCAHCLLP